MGTNSRFTAWERGKTVMNHGVKRNEKGKRKERRDQDITMNKEVGGSTVGEGAKREKGGERKRQGLLKKDRGEGKKGTGKDKGVLIS